MSGTRTRISWKAVTAHELQGMGIGTLLIAVAEQRIRKRGLAIAELGVEDNNPRARMLYERLGYREVRRESASWNVEDATGSVSLYATVLAVLAKKL